VCYGLFKPEKELDTEAHLFLHTAGHLSCWRSCFVRGLHFRVYLAVKVGKHTSV